MTLSSTTSQRPANAIGECEISTRRPLPAAARTSSTDPASDDFLLPLLDAARHVNSYADSVARAHGLTQPQLIVIARLERLAASVVRRACGSRRSDADVAGSFDR